MKARRIKKVEWTDTKLINYIDGMVHVCSPESMSHPIRNCNDRETWVTRFLARYKSGKWQPILYGNISLSINKAEIIKKSKKEEEDGE